VDREKLRRLAAPLPFGVASVGLVSYLFGYLVFGDRRGGLASLGIGFVLAFAVGFGMRKASGLTWRESLWPRRAPTPREQLPSSMTSVSELARRGQRIEAMKMYRELTGADLKASLEAVDTMAAHRRQIT
jgi:hypothetical protein